MKRGKPKREFFDTYRRVNEIVSKGDLTSKEAYSASSLKAKEDLKEHGYITHGIMDQSVNAVLKKLKDGRLRDTVDEAKAFVRGVANESLKYAQKTGDLRYALSAAKVYDQIGEGDRISVKNRLLKSIQRADSTKWYAGQISAREKNPHSIRDEYITMISQFISSHPSKKRLEHHLSSIAMITGFLGSLFFLSSNITGNVIGANTLSQSNILGAVLLVIAIIGAFFYFKNR